MEIFITIGLTLLAVFIFNNFKKFLKNQLIKKIKRESIELYKEKNPEDYAEIVKLRERWLSEMQYSGHLGMYRDGSESDRQENIAQDKKVNNLEKKLREKVERANFEIYVKDIMRKYGSDEKFTLALINHQSGNYSGTEITYLSKTSIGFDSTPADRFLDF